MRRDTDRCQELLKFCSTRLNLRSVRAIRVEDGSKRTRGDETTVCNSQWNMTLVPGVPMKRQVKSQRRWKTANWKPPHLVRAAKAAGIQPAGRAKLVLRGAPLQVLARVNGCPLPRRLSRRPS